MERISRMFGLAAIALSLPGGGADRHRAPPELDAVVADVLVIERRSGASM